MNKYKKITWAEYYPLYKSNEHPPSTIFHKIISKNLAKLITYISLRIGISPNFLTLISSGLVILAAFLIFFLEGNQLSVILFIVFTQLSYALDCSDGVLARITNKGSKFGAFFDLTLDRFVILFIYLGVGIFHYYNNILSETFFLEYVIGFISMGIYLQYQLSTSFMTFIMPDMKGYLKNKKKWSFKELIIKTVYEFIDTGIFYFIIGISLIFNFQFYAVIFYGIIGLFLTLSLYILLYIKNRKTT